LAFLAWVLRPLASARRHRYAERRSPPSLISAPNKPSCLIASRKYTLELVLRDCSHHLFHPPLTSRPIVPY
jgi:hypothetical protein